MLSRSGGRFLPAGYGPCATPSSTLEAGSIQILTQRQAGEAAATKTRANRHTVDVGPRVVRLLREQQRAGGPGGMGVA